ncbi:HSF-type DNA-binding-domain-containing protein [Chiua virens]|nr:HSF-type DNA-binding-domain-containing protein [Chiua virens]
MDYTDFGPQQSQPNPQRVWPPHLLTPQQPQPTQQQQPFPSPVSAGTYFFPSQSPSQQQQPGAPQTYPTADVNPRQTATLSLNLSALSVASPPTLSPIGPHQAQPGQFHPHQLHAHPSIPHQPHHAHSHSIPSTSSVSPITPISPSNVPLLSPQPQFTYNFEDASSGLSPSPDSLLNQRRPSTGSSSELAVAKTVPRKRSLTNTLPVSASAGTTAHSMHQHSHSHSYSSSQPGQAILPHPIITTTASSPPLPTSPASSPSSHPSHSHSNSLSHSHSHSSLSRLHSPQPSLPHLECNPPTSPYDEIDSAAPFSAIGDDGSEDDYGSPSFSAGGSFANSKSSGSPAQQGQTVIGKSAGTNNFVTKLYHMINDAKSQHFITWTDLGTSFVVSNVGEFSRSILGSHFKHNNFSSFVRQLNMYGFHKINRTPRAQRTSSSSQTWEFSHPKFLRNRPDLLEAIKRKALEPDPRERNRIELPGEVARLLSDLREENRALWREVKSLSSRVPQYGSPTANHGPTASLGLESGHTLTHSRSSSNLGDDGDRDIDWEEDDAMSGPVTGIGMGASQGGEGWDPQSSRFFGTGGGFNVPGLSFNPAETSAEGEQWRRWAECEILKERKRVEKLVGVVKALVDFSAKGNASVGLTSGGNSVVNMCIDREPDGNPPNILQQLQELSLSFDTSPSPITIPIPSPSPSPSPHSFSRHPQHSPNIFITSPTSPSPYLSLHSRSPSRESLTQSNPNASHTNLSLSISNSMTAAKTLGM